PYKNVIGLGHILDAEGKKMSKSVGNVIDPWTMIDKYGVDTLRLWMYSVNQPGESKNFDEKTVLELHRQYFGLLYNVLAFYELYRDSELEKLKYEKSEDILDQWILAKLDELNTLCVVSLDKYKLLEPSRAIKDFIGDLSTWYLRRSRDRIKEGDKNAKQTLYFVLKNLAKIMAPFAPFSAEDIWQKLKIDTDAESVHLVEWPESFETNKEVVEKMEEVRKIVSLGLEARQKAGIKVRQPLLALRIKEYNLEKEYTKIIKDELNIKLVQTDPNFGEGIMLNTEISEELREEGNYRELVRAIQDIRKKEGLTPSDEIVLSLETNEAGKEVIQKFEIEIKKTVLASEIKIEKNTGEETKINDLIFKIAIEK
ncbi:MAG: class I tRNA ligase family protein, partial [Candidatus Staskawiczbacteria bacterium]